MKTIIIKGATPRRAEIEEIRLDGERVFYVKVLAWENFSWKTLANTLCRTRQSVNKFLVAY